MPPSYEHHVPTTLGGWRADALAMLLLVAIGLATLWPFVWLGFPLHTDDIKYHATSARQFLAEMQDGALYPRWLSGMNGGLGSPFFFFYGPVSFWLTSLTAVLSGIRDPVALVALTCAATLCASGLSAYAWLRRHVDPAAAAIGATLYMVLPYHLTIDLWTRAAVYEFNAFALTPLVFLGIDLVRKQAQGSQAGGIVLLSAAYAALIMTHIVTAMLVTVVAAATILLQRPSIGPLIRLTLAFALGLALSSAYLAPALGLRAFTTYQAQDVAAMWFLPATIEGHPVARTMQMLTVIVVLELLFALGMFAWGLVQRRTPPGRAILLWSGVTTVTLLAMFQPFEPLWNTLPVLRNAQFPFRILAITDLGIATLAAFAIRYGLVGMRRPAVAAGLALAVLAAFGMAEVAVPIRNGAFLRPAWLPEAAAGWDYQWFRPLASAGKLLMDIDPVRLPGIPSTSISAGPATASLIGHRSRHYSIAIDAAGPATLQLGQLDFVGWRAMANGAALPVHPSAGLGLVEVDIPAGRYVLTIDLTRTPVEQAGLLVSAAAVLVWAALLGALVYARVMRLRRKALPMAP